MKFKDTFVFIAGCARNPKIKGAVCPSSKYLARAMISGSPNGKEGIILELGAGSGAVTNALVERGYSKNLISVEYDPKLAEYLSKKYPEVEVVNDSAENVKKILGDRASKLVAVVSSLPFLSLPPDMSKRIVSEVENAMPEGARFIQFTYNLMRKPEAIGFKHMKSLNTIKVFRNLPPARVDVLEKFA